MVPPLIVISVPFAFFPPPIAAASNPPVAFMVPPLIVISVPASFIPPPIAAAEVPPVTVRLPLLSTSVMISSPASSS